MVQATVPLGRDEVVARILATLGEQASEFAAVYLFGSTARGTAGSNSDVDLAVIRERPAGSPLARLHTELAGKLERVLERPVEVVDLERVPVELAHRILEDGVLVHEGDRSRRIAVETRRRAEYFDMQPILREFRHGRGRQ